MLGQPTNVDNSRTKGTVLAVGVGRGCLEFFLSFIISLLSLSFLSERQPSIDLYTILYYPKET